MTTSYCMQCKTPTISVEIDLCEGHLLGPTPSQWIECLPHRKNAILLGSTQLFPLYEFMHHNQSGPMEALWLRWKDRLSIKVYLHHKIGGGIHVDIDCRE